MRWIRRFAALIIVLSVFVIVFSTVILLNFTAPNPTGRRYSSEMPIVTGQGTSGEIGASGENILSKDLRLPRNESSGLRQCLCSNTNEARPSRGCNACLAIVPFMSTYRRPDFIGTNFMAESKNEQNLLYDGSEVAQIRDYVLAAHTMNWPLWVFTRVNTRTRASSEFVRLVESTGGGVVPYFTVPGYVDPVDLNAVSAIAAALGVILLDLLILRLFSAMGRGYLRIKSTAQTRRMEAEEFLSRAKEKAKNRVDIEDSRPQ